MTQNIIIAWHHIKAVKGMKKTIKLQLLHCLHCLAATWGHALSWCNILSVVNYIRSSHFKPFYVNFPLSHAVFTSILNQHLVVNFTSSHSLTHSLFPKKSHYSALFNNCATSQWSIYDFNQTSGRVMYSACSNYLSATVNTLYQLLSTVAIA